MALLKFPYLSLLLLASCTPSVSINDVKGFGLISGEGFIGHTSWKSETHKGSLILGGEKGIFSKTLSLQTPKKNILFLGFLKKGGAILCPGGQSGCKEVYHVSQVSPNQLAMNADLGRYLVEFHEKQFFYRIQKRTCFVPIPHGCMISGWDWRDLYTYRFETQDNTL